MGQSRSWGHRRVAGPGTWLLAVGLGMLAALSPAAAAGTEVRDFTILVDGKQAGSYRMTLQSQDNGLIVMTGKADVHIRRLVVTYVYSYSGTEVWKDGRLQNFKSSSNDNGKRFTVTAVAEANGLKVNVNGKEHRARADAWISSYWHLPDRRYHNQAIPILDADTGKDINGRLSYMGTEQVTAAGQALNSYRFRVTGGPFMVDLWYDAQGQLVREAFVEDGHQMVLSLSRVHH